MFAGSKAFSGCSVSNKDEAVHFYRDVLGVPLEVSNMGIKLNFSNGHTVFLYEKPDHQPATFTVLNFPVESIDPAVDVLVAKGVKMIRYEDMPGTQDDRGIMRGKAANRGPDVAWFMDPSGNVLAVLEQ